jgi:integrase/recombinase XerD
MFSELFVIPALLKRYQTAPLPEQRAHYLRHLQQLGCRRSTLRKSANHQLALIRLLDLREADQISMSRIEHVGALWARPRGRRCKRAATAKARERFVSFGIGWLRFLGWFDETEDMHRRRHPEVQRFEAWMRDERGLSEATIRDYCIVANRFLTWLAVQRVALDKASIADIDAALTERRQSGSLSRRAMHDHAQRLRAFILFAEACGWIAPGLAAGIMPPRFMADDGVPKGLRRDDVLRLLASVEGDRPVDKRDRAVLMLLAIYGLRAGEVGGLRLDDVDWERGLLHVRCPKPGRINVLPLPQSIGNAIVRYLREARPRSFGRSLFLTMHAPIQPLSRSALGKMVRDRLAAIGVVSGRRGTHALRHAAAQHLLDHGMPMKVIGDLLGHRDPSSTAIYAKVDLAALREVATLDLEGLA